MKKKLLSILLSLAMVITMMPAISMTAFADTKTIYFEAANTCDWTADGAKIGVLSFDGNTYTESQNKTGALMTLESGKLYSANITMYDNIQFVRYNSTVQEAVWDKIWNGTSVMKVPNDGSNKFTAEDWGGEQYNTTGTWSTLILEKSNWSTIADIFAGGGDYTSEIEIKDDSEKPLFKVKDVDGVRTITLLSDITATSADAALVVSADAKMVLDLNGKVLNADGKFSVITVKSGGKLTLIDSNPETEHYFTVGDDGLWTLTGAKTETKKTVKGGVITGGNASSGGGVYVHSAMFNMNGGNIVGNTSQSGGGVIVSGAGAQFVMSGDSKIMGNKATSSGGGVYDTAGAKFTMNGGTISSNTALVGGGVLVFDDGTAFVMSGGSIEENTSTNAAYGGGVHFQSGTVTLGGTAKITDNKAGSTTETANNLFLQKDTTVTLGTGITGEGSNGVAVPAAGFAVGVTTQAAPTDTTPVQFTSNGSADDAEYFTSDNADYEVKFKTDHLELAKKHTHSFTYTVNGGKLTATCTAGCDKGYNTTPLTLTLTAPASLVYDGTVKAFTFADGEADAWTGAGLELPTIIYQIKQSGQSTYLPLLGPLKSVGNYMAQITVGEKTAQVEFAIEEAAPTPTPTPSEPTIVVPVSGGEEKVEVSATVSGEKATVGDISEKDIEKVVSGDKGDAVVEIDLSGLNKTISEVELPVKTVEKIAEATQASGKEEAGMSVKMSAASVTFDAKATQAMVDQAEGNTIQLVVDDIKTVSLNAVQKEAVEKLDTAIIIDAYLVSNGIKLCTESKNGFAGGKATVALQYEIKNNRTPLNYKVFYVDDNGKLTNLKAKYNEKTKSFVFDIEHFSNYAVAYDENGELQASKVNLTKTTTYKNGNIKLTFKGLKLSDGKKITSYQIYRSTSKKFNKNLKKYSIKRTANTKSYTWTNSKKLKKGTKYYYKVRGRVKRSDGTYAYTQWSTIKTAKCKKTR